MAINVKWLGSDVVEIDTVAKTIAITNSRRERLNVSVQNARGAIERTQISQRAREVIDATSLQLTENADGDIDNLIIRVSRGN